MSSVLPGASAVIVGYLINQYPKVSHSFIRREILALERLGLHVKRFAVRGWEGPFIDPADQREHSLTRYLMATASLRSRHRRFAALVTRPARVRGLRLRCASAGTPTGRSPTTLLSRTGLPARRVAAPPRKCRHLHAHFGTNPARSNCWFKLLGTPLQFHGARPGRNSTVLKRGSFAQRSSTQPSSSPSARTGAAALSLGFIRRMAEGEGCALLSRALFHDRRRKRGARPSSTGLRSAGFASRRVRCFCRGGARVVSRGHSCELVLAGDGEMRGDVEAAIRRYGLRDSVRITGWISGDAVREEILNARALVLASFAEGLPVALMEAMALGRPVITTFVAGIPELVTHGQSGWLVPAGDVDALADALEACIQASTEDLERMGRAARERALARHDIDVEAGKLACCHAPLQPERPCAFRFHLRKHACVLFVDLRPECLWHRPRV